MHIAVKRQSKTRAGKYHCKIMPSIMRTNCARARAEGVRSWHRATEWVNFLEDYKLKISYQS